MGEECTRHREQRLQETRTQRERRVEDPVERCSGEWWNLFCWTETVVTIIKEWVTEEAWVWVEWTVCTVVNVVSVLMGTVEITFERAIGVLWGTNQDLTLRFEIVVEARTGDTAPRSIPVPPDTLVQLLHDLPGPFDPILDVQPVGNDGTVTFRNMPTWNNNPLYARVIFIDRVTVRNNVNVTPPAVWDSNRRNFFHQPVDGINTAGGTVPGIFRANDIINNAPVTFRIHGLPIHVLVTYSFLNSNPGFRGDPGNGEAVGGVPVPEGIKISLRRERPLAGTRSDLIRGRTGANGRWDTVLYEAPADNPAVNASIHVRMNLRDEELVLGAINVHSFGHIGGTPSRWLIEVRSPIQGFDFDPQAQNPLFLGTVDNPFSFDINENTIQVGALPGAENLSHVAAFALQAIADVHSWFRLISRNQERNPNEYRGFELDVFLGRTPFGLPTSFSIPSDWVRGHAMFIEGAHFNVHSVIAHEFSHQISYQLGHTFGRSTGITGIPVDLRGEMVPYHDSNRLTTYDVALLEGWAEFVEGVFGRGNGVQGVTNFWSNIPSDTTNLWTAPGVGEQIEGCVARALWDIYRFNPFTTANPGTVTAGIETITGTIFNDADHNGAQNANNGEAPLAGITVVMLDPANNIVAQGQTNLQGGFTLQSPALAGGPVNRARTTFIRNHRFNPAAELIPPASAVAFDDENQDGVHDATEPVLQNVTVEFLDAVGGNVIGQSVTDASGVANLAAPAIAVAARILRSDNYAYPCVIPAALARTSNLDRTQANLRPLLPNEVPNAAGIFEALFYRCWFPRITQARDVYIRMLQNAQAIDENLFNGIRGTFWENNMLLPVVNIVDVNRAAGTLTVRLQDALGNPIRRQLAASIMISANPDDVNPPAGVRILGPRATPDVTLTTDINGEIINQPVNLNLPAAVVVVDINVQNLIQRATAAGSNVWVRGAAQI